MRLNYYCKEGSVLVIYIRIRNECMTSNQLIIRCSQGNVRMLFHDTAAVEDPTHAAVPSSQHAGLMHPFRYTTCTKHDSAYCNVTHRGRVAAHFKENGRQQCRTLETPSYQSTAFLSSTHRPMSGVCDCLHYCFNVLCITFDCV